MSALAPLIALTLATSGLLALVHAYLFYAEKARPLMLWTFAWCLYTLRFVAALADVGRPDLGIILWLHQFVTVASAVLLVWGVLSHTRTSRRLPWGWTAVGAALVAWISVAIPAGADRAVVYGPVFLFLAVANFSIAGLYLKNPDFSRASRTFISAVFILWGLHKLDYPLLRGIPQAAVWGYAAGALFTVAAGLGLLTAYLEQARRTAARHKKRFESLVESLEDVVFTLDRSANYTGIYGRWAEAAQEDQNGFVGRSAVDIYGADDGGIHVEKAEQAFREDRPVTYEWSTEDAHGVRRFFQTTLSPIRTDRGPPAELVGIGRDITDLKNTQHSLEHSLKEKASLLKEVHHRVKNNLQIIVSLLRLQARDDADERQRQAFEDMMARVASMATVHERLYEAEDLASVAFGEYLDELASRIVDMNRAGSLKPDLVVESDRTKLDVATAIPLGLIATELITNATRHAVRGRSGGRLAVSFQHGTESYALSVTDDGPGLPKDFTPLAAGSLGMALVWSLCEQLGASLDWKTGEGTTFTVNVPIPDTEAQESSPGA